MRLLSFSDGDIEKIVKNTIGLRKIAVPSGAYAGIDGFTTVTNEFSDFATKDLPADIAYKIIKVMLENGAEIKRALSSYSGGTSWWKLHWESNESLYLYCIRE